MRIAFWKSSQNRCPEIRKALSAYLDKRLDLKELTEVEEHLNTCRGCREELESLRATVALLHLLPEVTPSRSFAVAPAKPLPGWNALPVLRFVTVAVVLLLVLAFAADRTNLFTGRDSSSMNFGPGALYKSDANYWLVPGVRNSDNPDLQTPVNMLVPDENDNDVYAVVNSLSADGVVWGDMMPGPDGVLRLVLEENENAASPGANTREYVVLSVPSDNTDTSTSRFSVNDGSPQSAGGVQGKAILNMVPANSDNTVLYSFDVSKAASVEVYGENNAGSAAGSNTGGYLGISGGSTWLRSLEYGLAAVAAILVILTLAVRWRRKRSERIGA